MLAHPLEEARVSLDDYAAEWKWDGIRVQLVHAGGETRLYSRAGDDITGSFPDVAEAFAARGRARRRAAGEGRGPGRRESGARRASTRSSSGSAARSSRRRCSATIRPSSGSTTSCSTAREDLRALPLTERRARLEALRAAGLDPERFDLSALIEAEDFEALEEIRAGARDAAIEGVMLKRRDSPYVAGPQGRPLVQMEARSARRRLRADVCGARQRQALLLLFGLHVRLLDRGGRGELLPVGKAYFGFTDEELKWLDRFVRNHTIERFGPVREVEKTLVLEVAFDSIHLSKRHKSGLAMRFPRISRIRTDKPAAEADTIETL